MTSDFHLETERLILRPLQERDAEAFSTYRSDPEVARYQGWEAPYSLEQAAQFIQKMQSVTLGSPGHWFQIALDRKNDGAMIGDCAFIRLIEDPRQAEIAVTLARPFQGHGYAAEALTCLICYLFANFKLHRVRANIDPANIASARLLKRIGMRYEGRFVESAWLKGVWVSEDWYAILHREWLER
jgi:RimJ/RimL family protein N-acetyltransferase